MEAITVNDIKASIRVKGTIDYTAVLQKTEHAITIACNCPYFGECKHEVAELQYFEKHPVLKSIQTGHDRD